MEELIERLKRYSEQCIAERLDPDFAAAIIEAINVLSLCQMLGAKPEPQWIPVEERLPDFEGAVLCMCKSHIRKGSKEIRYQTIMYFDEDVQWFSDVNDVFVTKDAVTHWIPLPEPPKEETDA